MPKQRPDTSVKMVPGMPVRVKNDPWAWKLKFVVDENEVMVQRHDPKFGWISLKVQWKDLITK